MRHLKLLFLTISLGLVSCKEKGDVNSAASSDSTFESSTIEVCSVNPLKGYWISASYKSEILDNFSAYLCSKNLGDITEVWINEKNAHVVYANAEGEGYEYSKSENEESFEIEFSNNLKMLYKGDNKALIRGNKMEEDLVKCEKPLVDRSALEQFVVSHLFVGSYETLGNDVELREDGTLVGLSNYSSYKVFTTFEELSDFDLIEFRDSEGKVDYKAWEIKGDVIVLYSIVPGNAYVFAKGKEWKRLKLRDAVS